MKKMLKIGIPIFSSLIIFYLAILVLVSLSPPVQAEAVQQQGAASPAELITSQQTLSTTWVDLGSEINLSRYNHVCLWVNLVISDSTNVRERVIAKHTAAGANEYSIPIQTVSASDVKVEPEYKEFNVDADQKMVNCWDIDNAIPLVQFQIQAGAVGTVAGVISSAQFTLGY